MPIDWNRWESDQYVKLTAGRPKVLVLSEAADADTEIKQKDGTIKKIPCLTFKVTNEDGQSVEKEWSVTSRNLARQLRSLIEQTIDKGQELKIQVTQFGSGFDTEYEVKKAV